MRIGDASDQSITAYATRQSWHQRTFDVPVHDLVLVQVNKAFEHLFGVLANQLVAKSSVLHQSRVDGALNDGWCDGVKGESTPVRLGKSNCIAMASND